MKKQKVFISSVQNEFVDERKLLNEYFRNDPLLQSFFEPFIFEEVPANTHSPGRVYLGEVKSSDIYIGLLGKNYGYEDEQGISPTEREYDKARFENIQRWIYIKTVKSGERHPKELALIEKIEQDVSRKKFTDFDSLKAAVYKSCILYLKQNGFIDTRDFDDSLHPEAALENNIDAELVKEFVGLARAKRNFPLKETDSAEKVLTALKMLRNGKLVNSALLVFNRKPQQFFTTATIKCAHFHGSHIQKPIPDYKEFGGTVFNMADEAIDFILSKISLSTGAREVSNRVETVYEIPRRAISEAIINAVAHRNYHSKSSIQVSVFKDRIEVSNPGNLPPELEISDLKKPHNSYPHNPILADCLFLTGEIERYGTGTLEMFELTEKEHLKEPSFSLEEGFKVTLWRPSAITDNDTDYDTDYDTVHDTVHDTIHDFKVMDDLTHRLVMVLISEMSRSEMMQVLELRNRAHFANNYLEPALANGYIEMTLPDTPTSKKQKYRLTQKGAELQQKLNRK